MKKISTLFVRQFENHKVASVLNEVTPGCEWVLNGEGKATRKWDGTCCLVQDGKLYRRYDCKKGKNPPEGFVPAQEPDEITGHWPGWLPVDLSNPGGEIKFYLEGIAHSFGSIEQAEAGTYELCGPKINGNPEGLEEHVLLRHGSKILEVPRTYDAIKNYLEENEIEGIVFHRENGDLCKIKRVDFGLEWNGSKVKRP